MEIEFTYKTTNPTKKAGELKVGEWFMLLDERAEGHAVYIAIHIKSSDKGDEPTDDIRALNVFNEGLGFISKEEVVQPIKKVTIKFEI